MEHSKREINFALYFSFALHIAVLVLVSSTYSKRTVVPPLDTTPPIFVTLVVPDAPVIEVSPPSPARVVDPEPAPRKSVSATVKHAPPDITERTEKETQSKAVPTHEAPQSPAAPSTSGDPSKEHTTEQPSQPSKVAGPAVDTALPLRHSEWYAEKELDRRPSPTFGDKPKYPTMAKRSGIEGQVTVKLRIDSSGRIQTVDVLQPSSDMFVSSVLQFFSGKTFHPAQVRGVAVPCEMVQTLYFRLDTA